MERVGSATPNSMVVLERGAGGASTVVDPSSSCRPPSGRQSRNMTPIQRSGSQLEILPLEDESNKTGSGSRGSSRTSHRPSSRSNTGRCSTSRSGSADESPRMTHSAGSSGQRSLQGHTNLDAALDRANSLDSIVSPTPGSSRPGSAKIHKQVSLTTVKRNQEMQERWNFVPEDIGKVTFPVTNGTGHTHSNNNEPLGATGGLPNDPEGVKVVGVNGGNGDGINVLSEKEKTEQRLKYLMEQLSMKDKELQEHEERRKSGSAAKRQGSHVKTRDPSTSMTDSYYISTGGQAEMNLDDEASSSKVPSTKPPPFLEDSRVDGESKMKTDAGDDEDEDDEDEEDEEEGPTAPIELMGEFLDAVMDEDYETADKLCKMILIYEPDNPECLQFKPLIEEMLKKIWHRQLYGSSSEDESDDDDEDEEEDDDEEEDSDEESDEESSDSSEESDDEEEEEEEEDTEVKSGSTTVVYQNGLDAVR